MPAGDRVDPIRHRHDVVDAVDLSSKQIEAHRAHAECGKRGDLRVGINARDLRHAGPTGAEFRQNVHQVALIVRLERAGHDGARHHAERPRPRQIVFEWEVQRRVAQVRHDRETMVDDVTMAVEHSP
jgi:hypothetical protein